MFAMQRSSEHMSLGWCLTFLISCGHHLVIFEDKLQDGRSFTAMYVTGFCDFCVLLRHYYSLFPRRDIQLSTGSITKIQKSKNISIFGSSG
jgi:hypothetical protein